MGEEKERKKRKERNGQYQNQDFWTELNDKHIDEIDFTCTSLGEWTSERSRGDALVSVRCDGCTLQF